MISFDFFQISFCKLKRISFPYLCTSSQRRFSGCLRCQFRNQTNRYHFQSACCTGAGIFFLKFQRSCGFFQNFHRIGKSFIDICFYCCIGCGSSQDFTVIHIHCRNFCVCTSKVHQKNWFHVTTVPLFFCFRFSQIFVQSFNGCFRCGSRSEYTVKSHLFETFFYFIKRLLSNYDISTYI